MPSIPIWQVRFDLALPAAPGIGAGMFNTKRPYPLKDRIQTVSGAVVIVPVARGRPIHRAATSDRAVDSMNSQIEMAAKRLMQHRLAIRRATADVRRSRSTLIM